MKKVYFSLLFLILALNMASLAFAENQYGDTDMPGGDVDQYQGGETHVSGPVTVDGVQVTQREQNRFEFQEGSEVHEIKANLEVKSLKVGEVVTLVATLSNGDTQEIKILPTAASDKAREKLKIAQGNEEIEIEEEVHKNTPRAVYHFNSDKTGKFLGLWKIRARYQASIDTETGEVLDSNTPWWSFLITGEDRQYPEDNS